MLKFKDLSYWEKRSYLEGIDVAIVGAGIVGMNTAIALKNANPALNIIIIERGYLPTGASTKNAGFACFGSPGEIKDDLTTLSEAEVWDTVAMRFEGLRQLLEVVNPHEIGYETCGSWDLAPQTEPFEPDFIAYLNENIERITGMSNAYSIDQEKIKISGFQGFGHACKNRLEGSLLTDKLIEQLHLKCINLGIKFLFGTAVEAFENNRIHTQFGEMYANQIVVCTNGFAARLLPLDVQPARAQVLVTSPINNLTVNGTFHFDHGYYYFRNIDNRILFGGGRNLDFVGEQTATMTTTIQIQEQLISMLQTNILPNQSFEIAYQWAGTMGVGTSKKPIIQRLNKHQVVGVRMGGMGVAIGALVGQKLSNLVLNA